MFSELMRVLGYGLCHQLGERSFFAGGVQLPVCARDTGIYLGFVVSVIALQAIGRSRRSEPPGLAVSAIAAVFLGVMVVDGVTSYAELRSTTNDIRLLTGLMAGFSIALFATPIVNGQLWREPSMDRVLYPGWELAGWLIALPAAFVAARWMLPLIGPAYPAVVAVSIVATFWWVNLAIVCLFRPFERRAGRLRDAGMAHLAALALAGIEIGAGALFRAAAERIAS